MSVASRNPFAALDEEDNAPSNVPAAVKKELAAQKRSIPGLNATARNGSKSSNSSRPAGGEGAAAGGADFDAPLQRDGRSSRGGSGGRGRGESRGRGRGGRGGRGRQFDRHSATGKDDSAKKIEQGWGGEDPKRELDAEDGAKADAAKEEDGEAKNDADGWGAEPANGTATAAATAAPIVEEEEKDNTKTLDEYLAEQAAKRAQIGGPKPTPREAETDAKALGTKFTKQSGDDYYATTAQRSARQRDRKEKQILEIDQSFNSPAVAGRGRGAGGDRGGDRGGRGGRGRGSRGGGRGGFESTGERGRGGAFRGRGARGRGGSAGSSGGQDINLSSDAAFPALG